MFVERKKEYGKERIIITIYPEQAELVRVGMSTAGLWFQDKPAYKDELEACSSLEEKLMKALT